MRRLLFENLVFNLALLLGLTQALLWFWLSGVVLEARAPGWLAALGLPVVLVGANTLLVPSVRRARIRTDWVGSLARLYVNLGVGTMLVGLALGATWLTFLLLSGLAGAFGGSGDLAFQTFRVASAAAVAAVGGMVAWGFTGGQWRVERTRLRARVPGLDPELAGLRIVQISDLHIGNGLEKERLDRMVARTNALDPDVTVVTGDIFDWDPSFIEDGCRRLGALRARYGVYAVLGNHDHHAGAEAVAEGLARLAPGIRLLRDETVRLPTPRPLYLAGVEDPGRDWSARKLALPGLDAVAERRPSDAPVLLLVHRPEAFHQAARLGFPLVLTGHTHGGQMALPTPGGRYNLARLVTPLTRGIFRERGSMLYVNRGIGVGGPALRFNCRREIATIELEPAASEALLEYVH